MYAALWRALPGNRWAKSAESGLLFLVAVAILFLWVFPLVTPYLPFENVTVQPSSSPATTPNPTGATP